MVGTFLVLIVLTVTPETLIADLGSSDYKTREAAEAALLLEDCVPALMKFGVNNVDPEIRGRARRIYAEQTAFIAEIEIPIWLLPSAYRFDGDIDLAKHYYGEALRDRQKNPKEELVSDVLDIKFHTAWSGISDQSISEGATILFAKEWLHKGRSKAELLNVLSQMTYYSIRIEAYSRIYVYDAGAWQTVRTIYIPSVWNDSYSELPIEQRIQKLDKEWSERYEQFRHSGE